MDAGKWFAGLLALYGAALVCWWLLTGVAGYKSGMHFYREDEPYNYWGFIVIQSAGALGVLYCLFFWG